MKVLVTGAAGFTGSRMIQFLSQQKVGMVTGLVRKTPVIPPATIPRTSFLAADLLDRDHLEKTVAGINPGAIIHLGGLTHGSLNDLLLTNVVGTKNILDAGYAANPDCRMLVVSSSAVYGYPGPAPITESTPLQPLNEYGISKMAQEVLAIVHHELNGSFVSVARPFNLAGPGQSESFVCGRIVGQVARIGPQEKPVLHLLETSSSRDLIDIRDAVRGYWALASHPEFSQDCAGKAFNLGSGKAYEISQIIAVLEEITGRHYSVNLPPDPVKVPIP
jgi:nucleoside-diphosphate-sugar epimerase